MQQQKDPRDLKKPDMDDTYLPDMTPQREGGDDSLAESSPYDFRDDEKVLINKPSDKKNAHDFSQSTSSDE